MSNARWRRIVAFLVLTYALSTIFYLRIASTGKLKMLPVLGLMWCPAAAAVIVRLVSQRNLHGTGWTWGATRWQVLSYLLPLSVGLVVYGLVWSTGIGGLTTAYELTLAGYKCEVLEAQPRAGDRKSVV